jgi:hypothetical protein
MRTELTTGVVSRAVLAAAGVLAATVAVAGCTGGATAGSATPGGSLGQAVPTTTVVGAPTVTYTSPAGQSTSTGAPATTSDTRPAGTRNGTGSNGTGSTGTRPTVVATHTAKLPECKPATLKLSFGAGDAGMSQQHTVLRFTNVGSRSCVIVGFPGVSYVAGDKGTQVGAPARRVGRIGPQVTLTPGEVASTVVSSVSVGVFDPATCRPTPVRGYRIYPPDSTASMFIPLPAGVRGCAGTSPDPQLTVVTIRAGRGEPDQH